MNECRTYVDRRARGAIFFDRDGVLNVDSGFVHRIEDFQWVDGAREAVKMVNQAGLYAIVVTNQSGVARGFFGEEVVRELHDWMARDLATIGARIDAFYYCPYLEDAKVASYRVADHPDRKPNPGMILKGLRDFSASNPAAPRSSATRKPISSRRGALGSELACSRAVRSRRRLWTYFLKLSGPLLPLREKVAGEAGRMRGSRA